MCQSKFSPSISSYCEMIYLFFVRNAQMHVKTCSWRAMNMLIKDPKANRLLFIDIFLQNTKNVQNL